MRRRETAIAVIVAAAFLSLMLLMDKSILNSFIKNTVGEDAFRTIIQFSFVTLLGGAIFLYFNIIKEENEKREKMMAEELEKQEQQRKLGGRAACLSRGIWQLKSASCTAQPSTLKELCIPVP
ncbi:hypothetical protein [Methylobacterium frigidaeris]|uniref:hypothetical protein n=1 Tax=Methylobacterium frigidaeris TaxID=2038277 RepID=UPI001EE12D91|nr:hypothetical protein [Methylobacterium frigidaeris]